MERRGEIARLERRRQRPHLRERRESREERPARIERGSGFPALVRRPRVQQQLPAQLARQGDGQLLVLENVFDPAAGDVPPGAALGVKVGARETGVWAWVCA
eukprot:2175767-Pleurochrysis_carterae.AAC.1